MVQAPLKFTFQIVSYDEVIRRLMDYPEIVLVVQTAAVLEPGQIFEKAADDFIPPDSHHSYLYSADQELLARLRKELALKTEVSHEETCNFWRVSFEGNRLKAKEELIKIGGAQIE